MPRKIPSIGIGMRLWLALAFAVIAASTAGVVTWVFSARSEHALKGTAQEFALAGSLGAADSVAEALQRGNVQGAARAIATRRQFGIFVFNEHGHLISGPSSRHIQLRNITSARHRAVADALSGSRYVRSVDNGNATLVALPVPRVGGAVLTYVPNPQLGGQVGAVHRQIVEAALFASIAGALAGLLVAMLIAARLRRIVSAADAIESGSFEPRLHPWLKDELGALAETIDRMRLRLRESFARLESERDRLKLLLERLHDGVIAIDKDLRVEFSNAAARRLLGNRGLEEGDELPDPWKGVSLREIALRLFEPGAAVVQEMLEPSERRSYTVVGIPARGRTKTAVLVLTDVSERERRERAERDFVTNAAHELRTPLATITGAIQVLQSGAKDEPEERDRFLGHIERESARLGRLTHSLLVLARAQTREEAPRLATVEIRPLLEAIAAEVKPAPEVSVEVSCPPGLEVLAEQDLVEQALSNLAANAVQNTERGRIVIAARPAGNGSVALEVSDTGRGIPPERQERIFDRFYRADGRARDNFGLGLAIVRQAVTALGGRIDVESSVGKGTRVRILLDGAHTEAA